MSLNYIIYDSLTGKVQRTFSGEKSVLQKNLANNESYIEGTIDDINLSFVKGGKIFTIDDGLNDEFIWEKLRADRNVRLWSCDWTQVPDAPVDQAAWAAYRQQLRDLPANTQDPRTPAWPTPPA